MVPPIIVVLQRCAHHNAECCASFFASIVHFPSNCISCFHLSSERHKVALSTSPTLGADYDVACPTNPTTPTPPFQRRPISSCCGNKEGANKYPVATLTIQKKRTQRVDLPRGPRRRKGAQGLGLERDAKI